jgi:iron complex outermembrane receptor protein
MAWPFLLFKKMILIMKTIHLLLVVLFTYITLPAFAHNFAEFKGKVTDADTNEPLVGATVYISDLKATTTTNANGEFRFNNIPVKGKFLIEVRFVGYKTAFPSFSRFNLL